MGRSNVKLLVKPFWRNSPARKKENQCDARLLAAFLLPSRREYDVLGILGSGASGLGAMARPIVSNALSTLTCLGTCITSVSGSRISRDFGLVGRGERKYARAFEPGGASRGRESCVRRLLSPRLGGLEWFCRLHIIFEILM